MRRAVSMAAAAITVALAAVSCLHPESEICQSSGGACPVGFKCTLLGDACIPADSTCGDGHLDPDRGEVCDDGNADDTDNCIANCTSDGKCGNGIADVTKGEVCDNGIYNGGDNPDGGEKCSIDCRSKLGCGNGRTDPSEGEECDWAQIGLRLCTPQCKFSRCGDDYVNDAGGEICDDQTVFWTECPYGMGTCQACRSCTATGTLNGPKCGDGMQDTFLDGGMEACDDGNIVDETSCADYGRTCTSCNSTCTAPITVLGPRCGDGLLNGPADGGPSEVCDDGNAAACGTCNESCTVVQNAHAVGTIVAVGGNKLNDIDDGGNGRLDTFTLNDGADGGNSPQTFEFDVLGNGLDNPSHQRVDAFCGAVDCTADIVATRIATKINSLRFDIIEFKIDAVADGGVVYLTNLRAGVIGNQRSTKSVQDNGFEVHGMDGGRGGDCLAGAGCTTDQDCYPPLTCQGPDAGPKTCLP